MPSFKSTLNKRMNNGTEQKSLKYCPHQTEFDKYIEEIFIERKVYQ